MSTLAFKLLTWLDSYDTSIPCYDVCSGDTYVSIHYAFNWLTCTQYDICRKQISPKLLWRKYMVLMMSRWRRHSQCWRGYMGSTGERGAEQWRGQYCFSTDWRCVTLNCFTVCSSAVWLPEKYAAMALWNRISCWCITFSCISNRHTTLSLKPHLNIRHFIYTHCTHTHKTHIQ